MENFKGTKGEWKLNKHAETTIECDGRTIANSGSYNDGTEETHNENIANAKLIAASKDLLEVLVEIRNGDYPCINGGLWTMIDNAINKATL